MKNADPVMDGYSYANVYAEDMSKKMMLVAVIRVISNLSTEPWSG